jgi:YVTN family beta-propeller protein
VSSDQKFLYAADTDSNTLFVLDATGLTQVAKVTVGTSPVRVAVGADGSIYVANRGSRSVSVVHPGDWTVTGTISTGVEPNGLQVSADGKTLYVVSATANDTADYGTLQAVDTATLQNKWVLPVGQEPRGLALVAGDKAVVSLYKEGDLQLIDLTKPSVIQASTDIYQQANRSALLSTNTRTDPTTAAGTPTFHPRAMGEVAAAPDGSRIFAASQLSREAPIIITPSVAVPYYQAQGPRLAGSVTTPAIFTVDVSNGLSPKVEDVNGSAYSPYYGAPAPTSTDQDYPQTSYAVSGYTGETVLQGPTAAVVDMTGNWLYMVNRESSNLAIITTRSRNAKPADPSAPINYYAAAGNELPSVHSTIPVGAGSDGIAILGDNATAFVYSQFDHKVTRVTFDQRAEQLVVGGEAIVAQDDPVRDPKFYLGRRLFFDANNREVSSLTASVACSSCHIEGRDDGHVWQFPDGPRQTPTLAGRGITQTAPFHWSGEFPDMVNFMSNIITERMGGTGLAPAEVTNVGSFMDGLPAAENPYYAGGGLTPQQQHGADLFAQAQCGTCHLGQWLTDNGFHHVGSENSDPFNPDNGIVMSRGFNTPSLKGLARTAPYLHDGSAATLMDRLNNDHNGTHGVTSTMSSQDKADLVEYLKTL